MPSSCELRACRDLFGLKFVVFRPHNVFGPRQNIGDRYRNVVGIFMNQILQGLPMTIFGDGTQTRAFSYIDDVAPVMAEAIDSAGGLEPGVQHRRRPRLHAQRAGDARRRRDGRRRRPLSTCLRATKCSTRIADHDSAARVLGERPQTPLEDGPAADGRVGAAARCADRASRSSSIEIAAGLPPSWVT